MQESVSDKDGALPKESNIKPAINQIVKTEKATSANSLRFVTASKTQVNPSLNYRNWRNYSEYAHMHNVER